MRKITFFLLLTFSNSIFSAYPVYPPIGSSVDAVIGKEFSFSSTKQSPYWFDGLEPRSTSLSYNLFFYNSTAKSDSEVPFISIVSPSSIYEFLVLLTHSVVVNYDNTFFRVIGWINVNRIERDVLITQPYYSYGYQIEYSHSPIYLFAPTEIFLLQLLAKRFLFLAEVVAILFAWQMLFL